MKTKRVVLKAEVASCAPCGLLSSVVASFIWGAAVHPGRILLKLGGVEAGLQIVETMLRFIYANGRRKSACVNPQIRLVFTAVEGRGVDRVSWRGVKEEFLILWYPYLNPFSPLSHPLCLASSRVD